MTSVPDSAPVSRGLILFADDERIVRDGLGGLLERQGFHCLGAATAEEAAEMLRATEFDVMISDIHMPGNAGLELIATVPQIDAGLPVILLTGRPTVATAARSVRLAVAAYLTKPPDTVELCQILDDVIARVVERGPFDQLQLQRLKKRKLMLKDQISKIESELLPDIIA